MNLYKKTSQTAFENYRPALEPIVAKWSFFQKLLLPQGLVGYFIVEFSGHCMHDVALLKRELESFAFLEGCSGKINEKAFPFSTKDKALFLMNQIDRWNDRKYWPVAILSSILTACVSMSAKSDYILIYIIILMSLLLVIDLCRVFASNQVSALREALKLIAVAESSQGQRVDLMER